MKSKQKSFQYSMPIELFIEAISVSIHIDNKHKQALNQRQGLTTHSNIYWEDGNVNVN